MESPENGAQGALQVLALVVLVVFASLGLGRFGFSMLLPAMQDTMDLTNAQSGQLQSWNSLGYLLAVVIAGVLATRFGPSRVITVALAVVAVSMVANGLIHSFPAACGARFFSGVGGAAANVPAMGLLSAWFSSRRRGLAAGCAVAGSSLGLAATGFAVPLILLWQGPSGWRASWIGFGAATLVICILCALFLRDRPGQRSGPAGREDKEEPRWSTVLGSRLLWQAALAYFAFGFSYSIYATFFVRHLIHGLALPTAAAGRIWTRVGVLSVVSGFIWGAVSDRWSRRVALVAVFCLQGCAFLLVGLGSGLGTVFVSAGLFAITAWSIPAVIAAFCGDVFGARLAPTAFGIATVVFGVGQVLGPMAGGYLADVSGSLESAFTSAGCVALVLGAGASALLSVQRRQPTPR